MFTWIRDSERGLKWALAMLVVCALLTMSCQYDYIKIYDFGGEVAPSIPLTDDIGGSK